MARTRTVSRLVKRFLFEISTSRSPLESWDLFSKFLFLFSKLEKIADFSIIFCKNSRSLLEPENRSRHFSFLFSKLEIWIPYFSFSSLDLTFWHLVNAWSRSKILWKYFSCSCFFVPRSISSFNGKYGLYFSLSASPSDTNLVLSISSRIEKIPSKMTKKCKM